jgi:hypothetical protein
MLLRNISTDTALVASVCVLKHLIILVSISLPPSYWQALGIWTTLLYRVRQAEITCLHSVASGHYCVS